MSSPIVPTSNAISIGETANRIAANHIFESYRQRQSRSTLINQDSDLRLFNTYLKQFEEPRKNLDSDPAAWHGITWGLIIGFRQWMLSNAYAIASVNRRLYTVKTYALLAVEAGTITGTEAVRIMRIQGFEGKEKVHVDENRPGDTRRGFKKADHVSIPAEVVRALKHQPDTPQGRRDALLMCLALDHGLRCGEIALLTVDTFNLPEGTFTFYRPKVDKTQTHEMTKDTLRVFKRYVQAGDCPLSGDSPLLRSSVKSGQLGKAGMSTRAITQRINVLGKEHDITNLSAHDGRHSWATRAARKGTPVLSLQEAGGWNSLAMPRRYVDEAEIANEGVKLE